MVVLRGKDESSEVLMVRRRPGQLLDGSWAFPGGGRQDTESALDAATRELREETGVELDAASLEAAGSWRLEGFVSTPVEIDVFLGRAPAAVTPTHGEFVRPADLVERWDRGEAQVPPSVLEPLRALAAAPDDPAATLAALTGALRTPLENELCRGVVLVPLASPTLPPATHTNCYVLGTGEQRIVVDPPSPWDEQIEQLDGVLDRLIARGVRIRELWLTHHHLDHVGAVAHLKERLGVPCRAHPLTAKHLPDDVVDTPLHDGEEIVLPGVLEQRWRIVHTPGHTRGHHSFLESNRGSLLVGDHLAGEGTIVIDPTDGNMKEYMDSLYRLRELGARLLLPGHGPPTAAPTTLIDAYIDHREARENGILAALAAGAQTSKDIVEQVYTDVSQALHALAEHNVLAHLEKLTEEDRVHHDGGVYRIRR